MKIIQDRKLGFDDVFIVPQRTTLNSRNNVELERTFKFYHSTRTWTGIPIICSNMVPIANFTLANALNKHKMVTCLHKYYTLSELAQFFQTKGSIEYNWVSIGYGEEDHQKVYELTGILGTAPNLCIDVPNAYMECFVKFCKQVRSSLPHAIILAGNVCTSGMAQELIIHGGVDIIKTGISQGSCCQTSQVAGVGYPQLSAVIECSQAVHGLKSNDKQLGLICSDGGCKTPGDICKSLCGGADFTMLGGMFAGVEECEGIWTYESNHSLYSYDGIKKQMVKKEFTEQKKKSLKFYGMSSHYAQEQHGNGKKNYRASEGKISEVPYKGPIDNVVQEICGGIRSCCTYIGAQSLKDMSKCGQFCRISK